MLHHMTKPLCMLETVELSNVCSRRILRLLHLTEMKSRALHLKDKLGTALRC